MTARVLVVDDERAILDLVVSILTFEGYDAYGEIDSRKALALALSTPPDLILLDMRMPLLDGWEFAHQLAGGPLAPPVVVMTAAQNAREWAREIDAAGYVEKPFDIDLLLAEVARVLSRPQP